MCLQVAKFKGILDNATRADSIVKDKYQNNREAMVLLGQSEAEIMAALPAAGAQTAASSSSQVSVQWYRSIKRISIWGRGYWCIC